MWKGQKEKQRPKSKYFLRYPGNILEEKQIWAIYNLTIEVESCFRFLKSDLNILPMFYQKYNYIEPHIWLGIVAYQITHYIRHKLKEHHINYNRATIVEKMQSQQVSIVSINKKGSEKIYSKFITSAITDQHNSKRQFYIF